MISTEIHEPDKFNKFKIVYYRSHDNVIRRSLIDNNGDIVRDYLYEYNSHGLLECIVLYAQDHITVAGVKNVFYYENSQIIKKTEEFKLEENSLIRTQKAEHHYDDDNKTCKVTLYGASDEAVGYELYGYRAGDDFMSLIGCFNMKNEKVSCLKFDLEKIF